MKVAQLILCSLLFATPAFVQERVLVIEGVTLIDGTGHGPVPNTTIVIQGNRIQAVGTARVEIPTGARRIDGRGKYVIPGLMDMHVHLHGGRGPNGPDERVGIRTLHGYLYSGVTSLYDAGNNMDYIFSLREKERSGQIVSPRIFATGAIVTAPGGHGAEGAITVEDFVLDREKLDEHIARKPDLLKITQDEHGWGTRPMINYVPLDLLEKVIRYYNAHGIRTTIHTSNELRTWEAIYAGVDTLAHPVIQGPVSDAYVAMMAAKKVPQVSTLTVGEGYSRLVEHPEFLEQTLYQATLTKEEIERLKTEVRKEWAERRWTQWMKVMTPVAQENLRKVHEAGGVVVLGTDQSLGPAVHRELELLVDGGISPLDALTIATLHGAIFLGEEKEMGTIEEGKLADLVILTADPTEDIDNAKRIDTVIKDGRIIDRQALQIPANAPATQ